MYRTWRYDPYHYCLAVMLERYVLFLERTKGIGDIMAESRGGKEDNRLKDFPNKYFLIDNDSTPDTQKKKIELLISGEYVFCWKWFINDFKLPKREKWDINDVCIYLNKSEYCFDELQKYFTNSIYDKIYFI